MSRVGRAPGGAEDNGGGSPQPFPSRSHAKPIFKPHPSSAPELHPDPRLWQADCLRFDEISREFHFYGSNDKMKLVSEEAIRGGFIKEENVLAMLPRAHHDPAPFLA